MFAQRVFRLREVRERTGLARSAVYAAIQAGEFPKPIKLSDTGRAVGWLESDIASWQELRIATRDKAVRK